jgi:hypothetical protein
MVFLFLKYFSIFFELKPHFCIILYILSLIFPYYADKATKKKPSRWKKKSKKNGTENSEEIDDDDEEEEDTVLGGVPRWAIVLSGMLILVVLVVMFIGTVVLNTDIHNAQKRRVGRIWDQISNEIGLFAIFTF